MTTYIEAIGKYPSDDWTYSAFIGMRNNGADIKFFENIEDVPLRRDVMVVGCIESTHYWFKEMGWKIPTPISLPHNLNNELFTGRKMEITTVKEALAKTEFPFFIKPYNTKSEFSPSIIKNEKSKGWIKANGIGAPERQPLPLDMKVIVSEVVDFVSEWRVYLCRDEILGVCNYTGDNLIFPDSLAIKAMGYAAPSLHDFPKAFALDVGVVYKDGSYSTYLVECNDFYALGNYGLSPKLYTRALNTRWRQLLDQNPVVL